jgi:putative ABC transport system permease protein
VDLPTADSLFQKVGAPPQSQPVAPPDNVILVPAGVYARNFVPPATNSGWTATTQVHVRRTHSLPPDPAAAYATESSSARNLEVATSGAALVGDNLGAALDAARKDALYAQTLFLFLGAPGAVLAGLLTAVVAGAATARRRRDQAILRTRGATRRQAMSLVLVEALVVGVVGSAAGLLIALGVGRIAFGAVSFGAGTASTATWVLISTAVGLLIATLTVVMPARRDLREASVADSSRSVGRLDRSPAWARYGLDFILLLTAFAVFRVTSGVNYALILAPEGIPTISVNYWAFLGPTLLWLGAGLLTWRLVDLGLRRGRRGVAALASPVAGPLAGTVAAGLSRQRRTVAHAVVLLALAVSFAASTATFNATYRQQAEVDAQLTNGADVTVTPAPGAGMTPSDASAYAAIPGVRGVESIQHRYAYVGADLQDLFGVNPATVASATSLQDAYFAGGTADQLMTTLTQQPDGVLVSDETVKDFQLSLGDTLNLRLVRPSTGKTVTVPFRYVGVAKEFPTAPTDSFLVANAAYVAQATGSNTVGAFLLDTGGTNTASIAAQAQAIGGETTTVTDISSARARVGSSLTSVDLQGLTKVELSFALALVAASGGLVLWLGLVERRRMFAIASLLGARRRHLAGFVVTEAVAVVVAGLAAGAVVGWAMTRMLIAVLTGVFDPPPASISVPWAYLAVLGAVAAATVAVASLATIRSALEADASALRQP